MLFTGGCDREQTEREDQKNVFSLSVTHTEFRSKQCQ